MSFLRLTGSHKLPNTFRGVRHQPRDHKPILTNLNVEQNTKTSTNQDRSEEYDEDETARVNAGFNAYFEDNVNEGVYQDIETTASDTSQAGLLTDMRIEAMNNLLEEGCSRSCLQWWYTQN